MRSIAGWGLVFLSCAPCLAQKDQPLNFDVASIKPYVRDPAMTTLMAPFTGGPGSADPGRVSYGQATLRTLVANAYGADSRDIAGPTSIDDVWYTLTATFPPNTTWEQFDKMLANFLADRFGLVAHRESKSVPGYEMTVASTGLKITRAKDTDTSAPPTASAGRGMVDKDGFPVLWPNTTFAMRTGDGTIQMTFRQVTMGFLASRLNVLISRQGGASASVIFLDKTGLNDTFDFHLEMPAPASDLGVSVASISRALEKQLGLQLTATKTTVDRIVIDHVDKAPTPN
jgi:uncharacterized protein (TIGR03435 family)